MKETSMFVVQYKTLKIETPIFPIKPNTDFVPKLGSIPTIVWECGSKKCCKKYRKAEKKRCKKCPKVN